MKKTIVVISSALLLVTFLFAHRLLPGRANAATTAASREGLSAGAALVNDKPTLFVFFPVEQCTIKYCLTAVSLDQWVTELYGDRINVVEVPVLSGHVHHNGTPPPLFVDWDIYPVPSFAEWMPEAELTDLGWGLKDSQVVFVSADQDRNHQFGSSVDWVILDALLSGNSIAVVKSAPSGAQLDN